MEAILHKDFETVFKMLKKLKEDVEKVKKTEQKWKYQ